MKHLELLNNDVEYLDTFTALPCCNGCNSDSGGGGSCGCDTYVCVAHVPICGCDYYVCSHCNGVAECGYINF